MKNNLFLMFCFFSIILTKSIHAQVSCSLNGTDIIYTNGVNTDYIEALDAAVEISKIPTLKIDNKNQAVRLAFNHDLTLSKDFLEATVQRIPMMYLKNQNTTDPYSIYSKFYHGGGILQLALIAYEQYQKTIETITNDYVNTVKLYLLNIKTSPHYLNNIYSIKNEYYKSFKNKKRILAISHSQGGLFIEDAFNQLIDSEYKEKYFSTIQIASPLKNEVGSKFRHATFSGDNLINFIRFSIGALEGNLFTLTPELPPAPVDGNLKDIKGWYLEYVLRHGVLTTYLYDPEIRSQTIEKINEAGELLESNCLNEEATINFTSNNLTANFNVSFSTENSNNIEYQWNFGDGKQVTTSLPHTTHNYLAPGSYILILTTTDNITGKLSTYEKEITVDTNLGIVNFCNYGVFESSMNISIDNDINFQISHTFSEKGNYDSIHTCECKKIEFPKYTDYEMKIESTLYFENTLYKTPIQTIVLNSGYGQSVETLSFYINKVNDEYFFDIGTSIFFENKCSVINQL